jgi:hypothetical protein
MIPLKRIDLETAMSKPTITLPEYRKQLKAIGYKIRTKRNSAYIVATIVHIESGDEFHPSDVTTAEKLAKHRAFYDIWNSVSVREDDSDIAMRVI